MKLTAIKRFFGKIIVTVFSSVVLALLGSCEIGLGPAVDLTAPEIEITSHKDNDSVGSIFAIRGTATDNEEVTKITIDFADADIHYQVIPGNDWQKKTSTSPDWQTITNNPNYYCNVNGNNIEWSIGVDSSEKSNSKTDNSYTIEASASDNAGNSGRKSKAVCTLTIDENNPVVSIYKPELSTGSYQDVENARAEYTLKDGNTISRLLNGTLVLQGRQSNALSFKALRIEFDNGKQHSGDAKYTSGSAVDSMEQLLALPEADLGDSPAPTVYFSKNLTSLDLREWSLTVKPEEWVNSENGLNTGSHVIRVVSTSLSTSNAWERKILGYFVWWPEADKPWITAPVGDTTLLAEPTDCYPGSSISGSAQDDDGIKSIVSKVYKLGDNGSFSLYSADGYNNTVTHTLPQAGAKYSAWKIDVPSLNGVYKYVVSVEDIYGTKIEEERYFKTSDVSAPKIEITTPLDNSSAILNADGNLNFNVKATDDGRITLFALCWLNPALRSDPNNKIKYLTGSDPNWNNADVEGWRDDAGNLIYRLDDGKEKNTYELKNKTFNLYSTDKKLGFGIGSELNGKKIPLSSQDFIFLASDGSKNTIKNITLTGDSITPTVFTIDEISIGGVTKKFEDGIPNFASKANGQTAVIKGKWKDMLTADIENKSRIYNPVVTWDKESATTKLNADGTWQATVSSAPNGGGTITATLTDFGGNSKVIQEAASIESTESGLSRIDSVTDDGSYKSGAEIIITLEFTKNVDVDTTNGTPTLTLNNGGIATYYDGTGSTSHKFKYTVGSESDTEKLYVTKINQKSATWKETGSGDVITSKVTIPTDNTALKNNLSATRKIKIDNTAPKVNSITALSSKGYYKSGASILFMLEFSEDVTITGVSGLNMQFTHKNNNVDVKTTGSTATGSKYVIMSYAVAEGDNASPLTFKQLSASGVEVTDAAGNSLSGTTFAVTTTPSFTGYVIDTRKPDAPSFGAWNPGSLVIADEGTSFTLSETESDATVEYSLDGGTNWLPYSGKVTISNNGSYNVTARQTDKAGNVSDSAPAKQFTVNKGALLKRITADSRSGLYTDGTRANPTVITGKIEFRTAVTLGKDSSVTLNVNTTKNIKIKECTAAAATKDTFTFEYTVTDGDSIANNGKLDVTAWDLKDVKLGTTSVEIAFPAAGNSQRFSENRDIKILTGRPAKNGSTTFNGEGSEAVLVIPFNRAIEKGTGNIVFEYYDSTVAGYATDVGTGNDFLVPTVLTAEEYGELSSNATIKDAYAPGMNGAVVSGTKLVNDTATKYILAYNTDNNNSDLVAAFKALNKHKVTIPIISDQVKVTGNDKKTLTVTLGNTYKLPVKGAKYKVTIPASAVYDEAKKANVSFTITETAKGIEAPQIRIQKPSYTIDGAGTTSSANAVMSSAQTAKMRIDCRTPGATLKYAINTEAQTAVTVSNEGTNYSTTIKNGLKDAEIPTAFNKNVANLTDTPNPKEIPLGGDNATNDFNAQGLKIAIGAQSLLDDNTKAVSYEYANRTVMKLSITGGYSSDGGSTVNSRIIEGNRTLTFGDLKVWVMGGDKPSGGNSIDPFPLSWGDNKNFKLMQKDSTNSSQAYGMGSTWHWVTWDLADVAYHGFVIGDVPSDAATNGPTKWYAAECGWVPEKTYYPLYPGATLTMDVGSGIRTDFLFRLKNEGVRK